ncbi:MAG: hypothetical protein R3B72_51210 [Polyangiaceae bacterium]
MAAEPNSDKDLWLVLDGLDDDLLDPDMPAEQVAAQLTALGLDPQALAAAGRQLAAEIAEGERLAWREKAEKRRDEMRRKAGTVQVAAQLDRSALLARLNELRASDPKLGTAIKAAARKRKPEESTDEDLRLLLEDMEALRAIEKDDQEE